MKNIGKTVSVSGRGERQQKPMEVRYVQIFALIMVLFVPPL